jgi:hypothetical protein
MLFISVALTVALSVVLLAYPFSEHCLWRRKTEATRLVASLAITTDMYREVTGGYPGEIGAGLDSSALPEGNALPVLLDALVFRCYPYGGNLNLRLSDVVTPVPNGKVRTFRAMKWCDDFVSIAIPKYILDPWGRPYVYRLQRSSSGEVEPLIYSLGPNGIDESAQAQRAGGDDIGNW